MKKNKTMILMFLVVLVILLLFILFFLNKEGMATCEYDQLSPPDPTAIDKNPSSKQSNIVKFTDTYNAQNKIIKSSYLLKPSDVQYYLNLRIFSFDEIMYYIKNNKFDLNPYIKRQLQTNKKIKIPPQFTKDNINIGLPNRYIFTSVIMPANQEELKDEKSEISKALKIYEGKLNGCSVNIQPPESGSVSKNVSNYTPATNSNSSVINTQMSLESTDRFEHVCKNVQI